ncbi:MAG: hypothetical protein GWP61_07780 [Chloroflexi bacterium]|nr:hypothetical protein [Chloroflexota bacterium]
MRRSPFIWLGSGRTRRRGVARKGRLLDQAARADLPVPSGGILLDEFYQICLTEGLAEQVGDLVVVPDPIWLHEVLYQDVRFPRLPQVVAVRSATAVSADHARLDQITRLDVDFYDPLQLATALREAWTAMNRVNDYQSRDILVMEMVTSQTAGTALTAAAVVQDQVTVITSKPGEERGSFAMNRLRAFQRKSGELPHFAQRLQMLLRGVRRTFGRGDWRIDWADDGQICWLLQVH